MKRALIVTTIGGFLPQFEMNDVRILQEYGVEVHYASDFQNPVYDFDPEELHRQGIKTHPISVKKSPARLMDNLKALLQLKQLIDREKIDLVHCHNPMGGVVARLAAALSKRKPALIYTAHGFHFYKGAPLLNWLLFYPAERFLAHFTDCLVTINREDEKAAKRFRLRGKGQVFLIHGVGVDMKRFYPRPQERAAIRERLGIPPEAFHVVTAAELNRNKNQSVVIQAIAETKEDSIYYSICGKGPRREELQREIDRYELNDRVKLLGYRYDMTDILQSADCFAFPSFREGLGIAAVEALACGVPVIAADNRGTREYMQDRVNGLVCDPADPKSFAQALQRLHGDKAFYESLCAQCRPSADRFSVEDTDGKMRKIYWDVINGRKYIRKTESVAR